MGGPERTDVDQDDVPEEIKDLVQGILDERGEQYGDYNEMCQVIWGLKKEIHPYALKRGMSPFVAEALDLICTKIGRLCTGNAQHIDTWQDIIGYATLVVRQINRNAFLMPRSKTDRRG